MPTCEEDFGRVKWFASKCCGNGLSSCRGDGVRCGCWLRCVWGLAWSLRACGACACWVWTHATWPDPRVVWLQLRSRRCAWSLPRSCPTTRAMSYALPCPRTRRSRRNALKSVKQEVIFTRIMTAPSAVTGATTAARQRPGESPRPAPTAIWRCQCRRTTA